ncbi:hypothetical protein L596_004184 [Steinernema carpocapsae]|uniref:Protein kinase domain-containing protein n=1 Tax=Steinernema carpocapsae TaxID=34508 RepID=A0A4U8UYI5_STECR|nr:hypothetical protein L596_004184 [Steinernema carpocapsae]
MDPNLTKFGALTLLAKDSDEVCKSLFNGLPISPSTRMMGRFGILTSLSHDGLCKYVEISRSQAAQNIVIVISEHFERNLARELPLLISKSEMSDLSCQIVQTLAYLHAQSVIVGYLRSDSVLLVQEDDKLQIKLAQYGLFYLCSGGREVEFSLEDAFYAAPESLRRSFFASYKSDIWALGLILVELAVGKLFSEIWTKQDFTRMIASFVRKSRHESILSLLMTEVSERIGGHYDLDNEIFQMAAACMHPLPSQRPSSDELLRKFFPAAHDNLEVEDDALVRKVDQRNELFYLWKLCGSSVETILINRGIIELKSPLLSVPPSVVDDYNTFSSHSYNTCDLKLNIYMLPDSNLKKRLLEIGQRLLFPSFEYQSKEVESSENPKYVIPTIVKEKDIDYQASRMRTISHLIDSYPCKVNLLHGQTQQDVPPLYRGKIWAALLNVRKDSIDSFVEIDTVSEQPSDRQLQVDIPRCHQYEELMTSPAAHRKLKTLLKAWLFKHPHYVYWQGLDSLTAPFLVLNFNNIPRAYASLDSFINRYLNDFFLKDNSAVIQEYLCVFNHLIGFLDAQLFSHLRKMDFLPELFAIPWFLTCFAHVLPLHKLFHLWDTLLLVDSSFPLFIGVAILAQLRPQLINSHFNDAILLFSDLPDLSIDQVVSDSLDFYHHVPQSCAYRRHATYHLNKDHGRLTDYTVNQLREFHCPRISAHDMLSLMKTDSVLIIDVRSTVEFHRGSLQNSISFPYTDDICDSSFNFIRNVVETAVRNRHMICILDNNHLDHARKLSAELVARSYNRVCILDGGLQSLSAELFTVSS